MDCDEEVAVSLKEESYRKTVALATEGMAEVDTRLRCGTFSEQESGSSSITALLTNIPHAPKYTEENRRPTRTCTTQSGGTRTNTYRHRHTLDQGFFGGLAHRVRHVHTPIGGVLDGQYDVTVSATTPHLVANGYSYLYTPEQTFLM